MQTECKGMIALGIDPSWSHTGLAVVECDVEIRKQKDGKKQYIPILQRVIHTALSAPIRFDQVYRFFIDLTREEDMIILLDPMQALKFDIVGIERAFVGRNKKSSLDVAESGGFCYCMMRGFNRDVITHWMQAVEWRRLVLQYTSQKEFTKDAGLLKTKDAKLCAEKWLYSHPDVPEGLSEHEIEAVAIACAACVKELKKLEA
jgi:Holliday junction resolvasome RuvABC endonuclease subunit